MLRLRTTASLSLLALLIGIGGTAWLSAQTAGWPGPPAHAAVWPRYRPPAQVARAVRSRSRSHAPWLAVQTRQHRAVQQSVAAVAAAPVELVPVAMPSRSVPYESMRHHLHGTVVLRLQVDGQGVVRAAAVAVSSGDAVLDAHAVDVVRDWRFAVPPGHPSGLSGELPMRFTVGDGQRLAQAP